MTDDLTRPREGDRKIDLRLVTKSESALPELKRT